MLKYYKELLIRFFIGLIVTLNYSLFYVILTPLTFYLSFAILSLFYSNIITLNGINQEYVLGISGIGYRFIEACIAGAAYYLLFILIIGIKDLKLKEGIKIFLFGSLFILVMNIFRIVILIIIGAEYGINYFDKVHLLFWNFVSGIYIALVWIILVKKFKINKIPYYEDIKYFYKKSLVRR